MAWLAKTALVLSAIGAINWGLTELGWNAVSILGTETLASIAYYLIAICGIYALMTAFK